MCPLSGKSQAHEATQLILNYEKLTQMKKILQNMYEGYVILNNGYNSVKDITEGNFKLHEAFLNGLLSVSPEVRKYYRVAEIIRVQQWIINEYQSTYKEVKKDIVFTPAELAYLGDVYAGLFKTSLQNLDELAMILTAGELRMSDFERLEAIDRLHLEMSGVLVSVREFNSEISAVYNRRVRMKKEQETIGTLVGINP